MTTVTLKPLGEQTASRGWVLTRLDAATRCAGDHDDAVWPDGPYALGQLDHGPWCVDCAVLRAPDYLLELLSLANATAAVLNASPIGWQRDTAEKAIDVLRSVLIDHGLA